MTAPNRNALWGRIIADELAKAGVTSVVIAPGSRSTPLAVAVDADDRIETVSHLDERSAGFFALGQAKRRGTPTALVSTSGTAATNFHPAVVEAHQSRVPLVVLTADRPPELWDTGANQTIEQTDLYGDGTRFARTLPEPEPHARKLRSLRTTVARAVGKAQGSNPGPVHLNVPFRKPLSPVEVPSDVPLEIEDQHPEAVNGREGSFVAVANGRVHPDPAVVDALESAVSDADRGLIVAGPTEIDAKTRDGIVSLARTTGFPLVADPLSGARFGPHVSDLTVVGGYDGYLGHEKISNWPDPAVVLRVGASPTSKTLRTYLKNVGARQFLVDPSGAWREATFTATNLVESDVPPLADALASRLDREADESWHGRFRTAEGLHWETVDGVARGTATPAIGIDGAHEWEGWIPHEMVRSAPDPATIFVSNSMPVRDLDRFAQPSTADIRVLGNRGASGIDGITSTGLGVASVAEEPVAILTGDLAYFHDMNGLLALDRFGIDATIVLVNNDGGGIFHMLPISEFDAHFEDTFRTPHGLDFEPTAALYGLDFARVESRDGFREAYIESMAATGTQVLEVRTDGERSHEVREQIAAAVGDRLAAE